MLTRAVYFLTGVITAMMIFLTVDHGFPVLLAVPVGIVCVICCICNDR